MPYFRSQASFRSSFRILVQMHSLNNSLPVTHAPILMMQPPHAFLFILRPPPACLHRSRINIMFPIPLHIPHLNIIPHQHLGRPPLRIRIYPLLTLTPNVPRVIEILRLAAHGVADHHLAAFALMGEAVFRLDALLRGAGFEGTEAEDAADEGPEVRHVDHDDGGGRFPRVPVEVDEVAEAAGEVVVTVQDRAEDLMRGVQLGRACGEGARWTYDEDTQTEYSDEHDLSEWQSVLGVSFRSV